MTPEGTTNVFIRSACESLLNTIHTNTPEINEYLCDKLIDICKEFAPGTFTVQDKKKI